MASELKAECGAVDMRSVAKLISDLATQLEVQLVRANALAAENAGFKDINEWCKTDAFSNMYREFKTAEAVGCCNIDCMHDAMVVAIMHAPEAPATDAFLAEIERKAIRKFINSIEHILRDKLSPYDTEEMLEAMRIFWKNRVVSKNDNHKTTVRRNHIPH